MAYVDYTFYTEKYGGAMQQADFDRLVNRAGYMLCDLTGGRLSDVDLAIEANKNGISMAMCAVIERLAQQEKTGGKEISLEIVGQHHVSFVEDKRSESKRLLDLVRPYLCNVGVDGQSLLYRGKGRLCGC